VLRGGRGSANNEGSSVHLRDRKLRVSPQHRGKDETLMLSVPGTGY